MQRWTCGGLRGLFTLWLSLQPTGAGPAGLDALGPSDYMQLLMLEQNY